LAKILVSGSSVVDLIFKGEVFAKRQKNGRLSLAFGGKYVPEEFYQRFGGGGANAAVCLAKQGFDTVLWSYLGNDAFGRETAKNLRANKVNRRLIRFKAEHTPISTILLTPSGERTIITYRSDADLLTLNNAVRREMKKRNWFALFSLAKLSREKKLKILRKAKKEGLKIFLSLHGVEYLKGYGYLKPYFQLVDILHINAHELADIFGGNAPDFNFKKTNFSLKLKIPLLVVSYDVQGSFAYTKQKIYYQPIIKAKKVVDTTGAGDAFAASFLGEYLKADSIEKGLAFGARNASSVIQQLGAQKGLLDKKS